jgi:hypothetical protein
MIPYQLAVLAAAVLVVRLYGQLTPRQIARSAFAVVTVGTLMLAVIVRYEWSDVSVVLGLMLVGLGQGALATLLFNVLVTSAPTEFAGDVGALRGTVSNLAGAVGTAVAGALVIGILSANIQRALIDNPTIPPELISRVDLDNVRFVSNDRLLEMMSRTTATPEQMAALEINADARMRALKAHVPAVDRAGPAGLRTGGAAARLQAGRGARLILGSLCLAQPRPGIGAKIEARLLTQ